MLEKELQVYKENIDKLRAEHPKTGFVVIKGNVILGVYNDREDALKAGIEKYGNVSFLVKGLYEDSHLITFNRKLLFNANP